MAKNKYILASVGNVDIFNPNDGELILSSKTLTESGLSFSASEQEIRGGLLNGLIGSYFTDSALNVTMIDATFSMEHIALNTGSTIQASANIMVIENVVTTEANTVEVSKEPKMFGKVGTIGWVTKAGEDKWVKVVFDPSTKKAPLADTPIGTKLCVKYMREELGAEEITVSTAFMPVQTYALLTLPLFKCSESGASAGTSSKVGDIQVEIPTFQLGGAMDLSLAASGNATVPLNGKALMTIEGDASCDSQAGYYAKFKQFIPNASEFDNVKAVVIADSDIDLAEGESQTVQVYALYNGGMTAPKLLDNSKLTFTIESGKESIATVGANTGKVEALSEGTASLEVVVTDYPTLIAKGVVTVTA